MERRKRNDTSTNSYLQVRHGDQTRYYRADRAQLTPQQRDRIDHWQQRRQVDTFVELFDRRLRPVPWTPRQLLWQQTGLTPLNRYQLSAQRRYLTGLAMVPERRQNWTPRYGTGEVNQCVHRGHSSVADLVVVYGQYSTACNVARMDEANFLQWYAAYSRLIPKQDYLIWQSIIIKADGLMYEERPIDWTDCHAISNMEWMEIRLKPIVFPLNDFWWHGPSLFQLATRHMFMPRTAKLGPKAANWLPTCVDVAGTCNGRVAISYRNGHVECGTGRQFEQGQQYQHRFNVPVLQVRWMPGHEHQWLVSGGQHLLALYDQRRSEQAVLHYQHHCNSGTQSHLINVDTELQLLISSGSDGVIRAWNLHQPQPCHYWSVADRSQAYWMSPDTLVVFSANEVSYYTLPGG